MSSEGDKVKVAAAFNVYNAVGGGKLSLVFTPDGNNSWSVEAQINFRKEAAKTFNCTRTSKVQYGPFQVNVPPHFCLFLPVKWFCIALPF